MLKSKKFGGKVTKKPSEEFDDDLYEDDFEDLVYDDDFTTDTDVSARQIDKPFHIKSINFMQGTLVTPSVSRMSVVSVTPETDSAGNNLNTKSSDLVDREFASSLESEFGYEGEEDTASSRNFDFRLFHEVLEDIPISKQKR